MPHAICPHCQRRIKVGEQHRDKHVRCPACKGAFVGAAHLEPADAGDTGDGQRPHASASQSFSSHPSTASVDRQMSERSLEQVYRHLPWYRRHGAMFGVAILGAVFCLPMLLVVAIVVATGPVYRRPRPGSDRLEPWHPAVRYVVFGLLGLWLLGIGITVVEMALEDTADPGTVVEQVEPEPAREETEAVAQRPAPTDRTLNLRATVNEQPVSEVSQTIEPDRAGETHVQTPTPEVQDETQATDDHMNPAELHRHAAPAVALVMVMTRDRQFQLGTGFFIDSGGTLVTNDHVLEDAAAATVVLKDETRCTVRQILARSRQTDLALLEVEVSAAVAHLPLAEAPIPAIGTTVYAIGNPAGFSQTFSDGIVSGVRDLPEFGRVIQTTAAISSGSSGGPLLTADGQVIGVTTMSYLAGQNINFAVPAARVLELHRRAQAQRRFPGREASALDPIDEQALELAQQEDLPAELIVELAAVWLAMEEHRLDVAGELLAQMRRRWDDQPYYWLALALHHWMLDNMEPARHALHKALEIDSSFARGYHVLGLLLFEAEEYIEAAEQFAKAHELFPEAGEPLAYLGMSRYHLGDADEGARLIREAIVLAPELGMPHVFLGQIHLEAGDPDEAERSLIRALTLDSLLPEAYVLLTKCYLAQGRYADAEGAAIALALELPDATAEHWLLLARASLKQDETVTALKAAQRSLELDSRNVDAYLAEARAWLAMDDYRRQLRGRRNLSETERRRRNEIDQYHPGNRRQARDRARTAVETALRLEPDHPEALVLAYRLISHSASPAEVDALRAKLVAAELDDPDLLLELGRHYRRRRDDAMVGRILDQLEALDPTYAQRLRSGMPTR